METGIYYILNTDGVFEKIAGELVAIPLFEEFNFFIHRHNGEYRVSEAKTGQCISIAMSRKEAIEKAAFILEQYGKEEINRMIQEKLRKHGISPRHVPDIRGSLFLMRDKDATA